MNMVINKTLPTLYFHIGMPKTGTSAIQAFFNHNRKLLFSKYKLLYPNFNSEDYLNGNQLNHAEFFLMQGLKIKRIKCIESNWLPYEGLSLKKVIPVIMDILVNQNRRIEELEKKMAKKISNLLVNVNLRISWKGNSIIQLMQKRIERRRI